MVSKHQFETVKQLLAAGVNNYVSIRQQAGLTSDELDDILEHLENIFLKKLILIIVVSYM